MLARLYNLCWLLLHLLMTTYETLRWLSCRLQTVILWSYDCCHKKTMPLIGQDNTFLERCKTHLTKLPIHLNIIIGPEDNDIGEELLSRIFTYALIMDINCISVYDTRAVGRGRVSIEELATPKGVNCKQMQDRHFMWTATAAAAVNGTKSHDNGAGSGQQNGLSNGYCNTKLVEKSLEIIEITSDDGRPLIATVCRELFEQRHSTKLQQLLQERTHLTQHIDEELSRRLHKLPDPELSIIFNRETCTFGMLPWQTRFTEFQTFESGRYFNAETFAKTLYRYSRCEQRWGK